MKKILALLLFIFDMIAGPIVFIGVTIFILIKYSFFYKYKYHWYDGLAISRDYIKYIIKNSPTLYKNSYNTMRRKIRA